MNRELSARVSARVRLLSDPPLWCWEMVDTKSGQVIDTSWDREWTAYGSPAEALRAAAPRLVELTRTARGAVADAPQPPLRLAAS